MQCTCQACGEEFQHGEPKSYRTEFCGVCCEDLNEAYRESVTDAFEGREPFDAER